MRVINRHKFNGVAMTEDVWTMLIAMVCLVFTFAVAILIKSVKDRKRRFEELVEECRLKREGQANSIDLFHRKK